MSLASSTSPNDTIPQEPMAALEEEVGMPAHAVKPEKPRQPHGTSWQLMTCLLSAHMLGLAPIFMPADFARLGWGPMLLWVPLVALFTAYSGSLFTEQHLLVPNARVFGDVGAAAYGSIGRMVTYAVNYAMLAGFPIASLLFATEALQNVMEGVFHGCSWQLALVAQAVFLTLGQLQSLHKMAMLSHVGNAGILLIFVGVNVGLLSGPRCPASTTSWFSNKGLPVSIVGMMHVVYGFGGQFAFVEFMSSMARPADFTFTVAIVAALEVLAFWYMGALGYYMRGSSLTGLITSRLYPGSWEARLANVGVLLQVVIKGVISQNVLIHAIVNMACSSSGSNRGCCCSGDVSNNKAPMASAVPSTAPGPQGPLSAGATGPAASTAPPPSSLGDILPTFAPASLSTQRAPVTGVRLWQRLHDVNTTTDASTRNSEPAAKGIAEGDNGAANRSSPSLSTSCFRCIHHSGGVAGAMGCSVGNWLVASVFVSVYSYLLAMSIPFLEQVVALLVSVGYPLVAFVLPCVFLIKLWAKEGCPIGRVRRIWFGLLIGGSFIVTGLGLYSSIYELQGKVLHEATAWHCLDSIHDGSSPQNSAYCS